MLSGSYVYMDGTLLTRAAWFLVGRGPMPFHGPGVGNPYPNLHKNIRSIQTMSYPALSLLHSPCYIVLFVNNSRVTSKNNSDYWPD